MASGAQDVLPPALKQYIQEVANKAAMNPGKRARLERAIRQNVLRYFVEVFNRKNQTKPDIHWYLLIDLMKIVTICTERRMDGIARHDIHSQMGILTIVDEGRDILLEAEKEGINRLDKVNRDVAAVAIFMRTFVSSIQYSDSSTPESKYSDIECCYAGSMRDAVKHFCVRWMEELAGSPSERKSAFDDEIFNGVKLYLQSIQQLSKSKIPEYSTTRFLKECITFPAGLCKSVGGFFINSQLEFQAVAAFIWDHLSADHVSQKFREMFGLMNDVVAAVAVVEKFNEGLILDPFQIRARVFQHFLVAYLNYYRDRLLSGKNIL